MSDGRKPADTPLRHAARGSDGADETARHHRAALPVDRSVLWTPNRDPGDPGGPAVSGPYELFIVRSAFRQIDVHARADGRESRFGFLLGNLYRCPESGVHYSVVDRVVPTDEPISEDAPDPYLLRAWADSQDVFREHGGVLIGWYHTHYLLGLMLSEGDREMNERYFGQPWQCCVLVVPDSARPMGAVFRSAGEQGVAENELSPFRELLAVEDIPSSGPIPTAVRWKNYAADRDVEAEAEELEEPAGVETPPVVTVHPPGDGSASSVTLVLADNRAEHMYPRLPVRRRTIIWLLAVVVVAVGGYLGGLQLFRSGGPPPAPTPVEQPPPVPVEVQRFLDASTNLEEAMLSYDERRQDFDLGRIGCEMLAGGYAAADDVFITMAGAYAGLGAVVDETLSAEYERLADDMNRLNQHFDASGCPRPE
jgi:proteasome lid subunit RPN8/RPN11